MGRSKASPWVLGTVFVSLVILVGAWMLLVSPRFETASQTRDQAESVAQTNVDLRARTAVLREQFANLDTYREELVGLEEQIPTDAELAALTRDVDRLAERAEIQVLEVAVGDSMLFAPAEVPVEAVPTPAPTEGQPADGEDTEGDAEGAETPAVPAPTGPAPVEGFVAVPFAVTVLGDATDARAFVGALQSDIGRLYLVDGFVLTALDQSDPATGRVATEVGDIELAVTGYVYVLVEPGSLGVPVETDGEGEDAELPRPRGADNPYSPIDVEDDTSTE